MPSALPVMSQFILFNGTASTGILNPNLPTSQWYETHRRAGVIHVVLVTSNIPMSDNRDCMISDYSPKQFPQYLVEPTNNLTMLDSSHRETCLTRGTHSQSGDRELLPCKASLLIRGELSGKGVQPVTHIASEQWRLISPRVE
eukprot:2154245-Amphidinium_carterae.2